MNWKKYSLWMMVLLIVLVYLFANAPVPLDQQSRQTRNIEIKQVLEMANAMNSVARSLYTRDIVSTGKKQGLDFNENWEQDDIEAGPLPAQFLRQTARQLQRSPVRLDLYLGSDYPINSANRFSGEQMDFFRELKATGKARFFYVEDTQRYGYMFADRAVVKACVSCHNQHEDSPKKDWQINEIMGATTWTYPKKAVGLEQAVEMIKVLRASFRQAYMTYLDKVRGMKNKPVIGEQWPAQGFYLPSAEYFLQELDQRMATSLLNRLFDLGVAKEMVQQVKKGS